MTAKELKKLLEAVDEDSIILIQDARPQEIGIAPWGEVDNLEYETLNNFIFLTSNIR